MVGVRITSVSSSGVIEMEEKKDQDLDSLASQKSPSILREFVDFLRHNGKWWLIPILVLMVLLGVFVMLSGTAAAPFIYTLF